MSRAFNRLTGLRDYPRGGPADPSTPSNSRTTHTDSMAGGGGTQKWTDRKVSRAAVRQR